MAYFSTRAASFVKSWSIQASVAPRLQRAGTSSPFLLRCNATNNNEDYEKPDPSSSAPEFRGFGQPPSADDQPTSTADALRKTLGGVSNNQGRVANTTNVVLGTDDSVEKWRELDSQVNEYPGQRTFKAIGSGGDDFVIAMTACVEAVVGTVHTECVSTRPSATGKWISVTVGPVWVETPEQVLSIYEAMKADGRLKFYI